MNNVIVEGAVKEPAYEAGSWWMDRDGNVLLLFLTNGGYWSCFNPARGVESDWVRSDPKSATAGFHFLCASADVVVRPHGAKQPDASCPVPQSQEDSDWSWYRKHGRRVDVFNHRKKCTLVWLESDCFTKTAVEVIAPTFNAAIRKLREAVEKEVSDE